MISVQGRVEGEAEASLCLKHGAGERESRRVDGGGDANGGELHCLWGRRKDGMQMVGRWNEWKGRQQNLIPTQIGQLVDARW